jgi:hypothetical protein
MLQRTVDTALAAGVGPVDLWCAPDADHPEFRACAARGPVTLRVQPEGDLGTRQLAALDDEGFATLLIGTDCPGLDAMTLQAAAQTLREGRDAVLVPAEDGGYVLIGLRTANRDAHATLFANVAWGTPRVLPTTRRRLRAAGLDWSELQAHWDVDTPADCARLCALFPGLGDFLPALDATS